jgi:protein-arginine kinase activator protein McsA
MMIDLNELDPNEKKMLLQYLQEEYDKHPEQFPFPKEHLSQIIEQENFDLLRDQIRILQQQKQVQEDDETDENEGNEIEGGE